MRELARARIAGVDIVDVDLHAVAASVAPFLHAARAGAPVDLRGAPG